MRQLSGHDANFLYSDTVHANANVTFVQIYDQSTVAGGKLRFKSILAHIESRLQRTPIFRSRLQRVPLELDYPYWVEDEHFDLEYHVRHIALPKPGDWRQFCIQASRIHSRALDMNRPLWEIYVIEGLDSVDELPEGSFALLTKVHRAAVDIENRNPIVDALHDTAPLPPPATPPEPWFPEGAPNAWNLMVRGAFNAMVSPLRLVGPLTRLAPAAMAFAADMMRPEHQAATRFHSVVSAHRVFDTRRFMLAEFHRIRGLVPGATVNDAVLAVCAGGLRRYLAAQGELPAADLKAYAPLALPDADPMPEPDRPAGPMQVQLGTNLADPVERLAWIQEQTASSPDLARAEPRGAQSLPTCTITSVPCSAEPLYLIGAHMTYYSAIMPIADGMGLVFAVTSYGGRVLVSPTSCRELMPDPQAFTQCVRDSFQEYLALAPAAPRAAPVAARSARRGGSASGRRPPSGPKARKAATVLQAAPVGRRRSTTPRR